MAAKTQTTQQAVSSPPVASGLLGRQGARGQNATALAEREEREKQSGEEPAIVEEVLGSAGEPLDPDLRAFLEPRFERNFSRVPARLSAAPPRGLTIGAARDPLEYAADAAADRAIGLGSIAAPRASADFSGVMIHRGTRAAEAARVVGARAFTVENHIVFGAGEYQPHSFSGRRLLAHELAHVVQQTGPAIRRKVTADDPALAPPDAPTNANNRKPDDLDPDKPEAKTDDAGQAKGAAEPKDVPPDTRQGAAPPKAKEEAKDDAQQKTVKAADAAKQQDKAADGAAKPVEPQAIGDLSTGDLALVDKELAEHQRWGAATAMVGAAESGQRAEFIAKGAAAQSSFLESGVQGAKMAAGIKIAEKVLGKVVLKIAVTRLGASAVKFTPVPGIGAAVGGAIAAYELANRDWKATGETIGKFGKGASQYDELANDIEAISTVIDVATGVLNVIAGIIGAISFGMWAVSIATLGVASPLAFTLSAIAGAIGVVSLILDGINALVLKELVTVFRVLDAFTSEADPRDVIAQGDAINRSAGAATGFAGGFAGAQAVEAGAKRLGPKKPSTPVPDHKTPGPGSGESFVKAEPPPEGVKGGTDTAKPPAETKVPAVDPAGTPPADAAAAAKPPADVQAPAVDVVAKPPEAAAGGKGTGASHDTTTPAADTALKTDSGGSGGGEPPKGPPGGEHQPPGGEPPAKKPHGPIDERSFAELNDLIKEMDEGSFGDKLQSEAQRAQQPPPRAPAGTRYGKSAYAMLRTLLRGEQARPPGTQAQHYTKWLDATTGSRGRSSIPLLDRMTPQQISQNRGWLQSRRNLPATLGLVDPQGGGTRYHVGDQPAPRPTPQLDLFPSQQPVMDQTFSTEHKFMDNYLIEQARTRIGARNQGGVDPNLVALWAGAQGRFQLEGIPGQGDWGWQPKVGAGTQVPLPGFPADVSRSVAAPRPAPPGQHSFDFDKPAANPNQFDLFGKPKAPDVTAGQPTPAPQPGSPLEPAAAPQPGAPLEPTTAGQPDVAAPPKMRIATDVPPEAPKGAGGPAEPPKLRVPTEEELKEAEIDKQAELEQQQDEQSQEESTLEKERIKGLLARRLGLPMVPPSGGGGPSKKDEPESQLRKNVREFISPASLLSPTTAATDFAIGAGSALMGGAKKAASEPIVRHVNPKYPPPPCTPQDIVNIQNDILQALDARAQAEAIAWEMNGQEKHHKANEKPLTDMQTSTADQITATDAHKDAVARRAEANGKKQDNEKKVDGKIAHYSEEAGKLATIKIPMRGFKKFTGLAYSLPDDPDILVNVKNNLIKMNKDTTKFLDQLDAMDSTMNDQQANKGDRQQKIQDTVDKLHDTDAQADQSNQAFDQAKETTEGLDKDNKARLDDASKMHGEADRNAYGLKADADQKKAKAQSMAAAMQAWAQSHRKARLDALEETKTGLEKQGYKILEVKEL